MKSIEIVTHCWSGSSVPIYHRLLQCQLSSIVRNVPYGLKINVSIFYNPYDVRTVEILSYFDADMESYSDLKNKNNVAIKSFPLEERLLFRRAIGRNLAAICSQSDVIWFTDVDYCFIGDCLLKAHDACMNSECNMVFPRSVNIHRAHSYGDVLIDKLENMPFHLARIDPDHFEPRKERRAIGGIQIVRGDWCRQFGYLQGTKWTEPVDPSKGFLSCKGDVPFRKSVGQSEAVSIPGVYRIRHSHVGRDGGTVDHGEKTRGK